MKQNVFTRESEERQNLVYADIGPSSRKTKLPVSTCTLDDDRVEYA